MAEREKPGRGRGPSAFFGPHGFVTAQAGCRRFLDPQGLRLVAALSAEGGANSDRFDHGANARNALAFAMAFALLLLVGATRFDRGNLRQCFAQLRIAEGGQQLYAGAQQFALFGGAA